MNAPLRHPVLPAPAQVAVRRRSEIVPLRAYLADPDESWDAIAARPSEPNAFAERWFVEASVRHLDVPADARMLVVRAEGQLIGMLPIIVAPKYGRMPVRHVENWLHYNSFLGAPLVRRSFEAYFWHRALALLDADPDAPSFLHLVALDGQGPLAQALRRARTGTAVVHRSKRALLQSDLSPNDYYEATVRKKKRKEIGRLQHRLAELGNVGFSRLTVASDLDGWIDSFLALEASGWKGRDGAALANARDTENFVRDALRGAFAAGRLEMIRLDVDGRTIAMLVNFLTPPGSFSFKIAFDEDYARFSPGVLIQLENLKILETPGIGWMDSCAVEGHPMIESLWAERREIVRISVPLKGKRRRATFAACRALETASALVRKAL
ncbi:GNAT family N-acetyltransferase [Sphingomonas sp. SUN039]|uniref:GNAT family N-acetyltransferase n=1 Tax=Sphingomonas sp. SUN039 TaxID=2937787 RepID=UPI0021645E19|nr:GNAT family N-acetyltransferase [Sphingomonas sp. SUN039]UVO54013.1 GNAT family N-acetyltransferase [Sphingomonas sp. SUN039]